MPYRFICQTLASTVAVWLACAAFLAPHAHAADYWVTLRNDEGEIAQGVNSFSWHTYGGPWKTYGGHCEANAGAKFVAGAYCVLRFDVPSGLSAGSSAAGGGGVANGTYRVGGASFLVRTSRPGGSPDYTSDATAQRTTHGPYQHGWGALGRYVETGLHTTAAVTTPGTVTNWFHHDSFTVLLRDASAPTLRSFEIDGATAGGWRGPGCHAVRYGWHDSGSQLWSTGLADAQSGQSLHGWQFHSAADVVATGVGDMPQATCVGSSHSGARSFRTSARDRSGNVASSDINVAFDVTPPSIGIPMSGGSAVTDSRTFGSASGYRPTITAPIADAHSGVARVEVTFAGAPIAHHVDGGSVVITPAAALPIGTHALLIRVTDGVGQTASVSRTVTIVDDVPPVLRQVRPFVAGSNTPVLDVTATDDRSAVLAGSWRVEVNGDPVVVDGSASAVNAAIGRLVDGTHEIVATAADASGNVGVLRIAHSADGASDVPQLTGIALTGITVYDAPRSSLAGETHRVKAVIARHGRPVAGRAELRRGASTVAFRDIETDGTVDMAVTINDVRTNLAVHAPSGAGLAPAAFGVDCPRCATEDPRPNLPTVDAAGNGTVGPTSNSPQPVTPSQAQGIVAALGGGIDAANSASGSYPRNVIYYVGSVPYWNGIPLAESGAKLDATAPVWKLTAVHRKAGMVRRSRSIVLRLWTNELSVLSILPGGGKATSSVGVRRKWRTITVRWTASSALGKRVARVRAGAPVTIRLRVAATDRNANRSKPRWVTIRTRA